MQLEYMQGGPTSFPFEKFILLSSQHAYDQELENRDDMSKEVLSRTHIQR